MLDMKSPFFFATFVLAGLASAEPLVQVVGADERPAEPRALHVFGGRVVALRLQIAAPSRQPANIRASLYQLAGHIAAPVAKDLPVVERLSLEAPLLRAQQFSVTLPDVRQATAFELRFTAAQEGAGASEPAGTVRLVAHSADAAARMKALLAAASPVVTVLGESARLKALLRGAGAAFEEAGAIPSEQPRNARVYLAEMDADAARRLIADTPAVARLLLFTSDPTLPAGVYWTDRGAGYIAKVTLPVLADFESAPERQTLFLHLLQRALAPSPDTP